MTEKIFQGSDLPIQGTAQAELSCIDVTGWEDIWYWQQTP